jgi:uncharacterized ferritin-like protein (DUF455 family)
MTICLNAWRWSNNVHAFALPLSGPFNHEARIQTGFSQNELDYLDRNSPSKK